MDPKDRIRLVVFAKLPKEGFVKSRLAQSIGERKACELYRTWVPPFIDHLLHNPSEFSVEVTLAVEPDWNAEDSLREAQEWIPGAVDWTVQVGDGLGERLTNAFEDQFNQGWNRVFALGTDSPHLSLQSLSPCFRCLEKSDIALGPTEDGGYYTIGMKRRPGKLFRNIRWSTEYTLADTKKSAQNLGLSVGTGPISYDLDTLEDLNRLLRERAVDNWRELDAILKKD
ncbi:MAG: TIGR04282 family arsenosugar biosynthesis glycosyltransferase [Candidatus Omnitrophica bacterium]|nr:TIGR04282 family arsenosugar biosynthesis glycosyltransferase [Candidatus Omnitrophota bacterium]